MSLRRGFYLGCSAIFAGAGGFWLQRRLIQDHKLNSAKEVEQESENRFRQYLACKYPTVVSDNNNNNGNIDNT